MLFLIPFSLFGLLIIIFYYKLNSTYNYWRKKGVPHEEPIFLFGSFKNTTFGREHMVHTIDKLYKKFSDRPYFGIYAFHKPILILKDPEILKQVLIKDFYNFANYSGPEDCSTTDPISSNSLMGLKDDVWRNLRAKLTPIFTSGKVKLMFPAILKCCEHFVEYIRKNDSKVLDVREAARRLTVDIISSCAFGIDSGCLKQPEPPTIFKMATRLLDSKKLIRMIALFTYFHMPKVFTTLKLTFTDKVASDYLVDAFTKSYHERTKKGIIKNDLIDHLFNLKKMEKNDDNYKFDDSKMASQAITFFFAGNDTTSVTLANALYWLALNPEIDGRLRKEIAKFNEITYESIHEMKYLDMILAETLRMNPVGTALIRVATNSYEIKGRNLTIDKNMSIMIPLYSFHQDENYFPEPQKFDPERFNEENKKNIKPFSYLPFGDGPRNCLGQRFAMIMLKLSVIHAIKNFNFQICDKTLIPMEFEKGAFLFLQPKDDKLFLKVESL